MNADTLTDRIYDAAIDETAWADVLQLFGESFGGLGLAMLDLNCRTGHPMIALSHGVQDLAADYQSTWWEKDAVYREARRLKIDRRTGPFYDVDFLSQEMRNADAFYQDFWRPHGSSGAFGIATSPYAGTLMTINVQRRLDFECRDPGFRIDFIREARHLSRALGIRLRLRRSDALQAGLAGRLADFDCAVVALDRNRRVLLSNEAFEALAPQGIMIRAGRLRASVQAVQERLDRLIVATLDDSPDAALEPDTVVLPRANSLLPLLIRAVPLKAATAERLLGPIPVDGVLLMALDPSHPAYPDVTRALVALGLTPAQSRVALLIANGTAPKLVAETLGLTEVTIRTTMKHLYARLGISTRTELARLVARVAPFTN